MNERISMPLAAARAGETLKCDGHTTGGRFFETALYLVYRRGTDILYVRDQTGRRHTLESLSRDGTLIGFAHFDIHAAH